jgi:hypothetical protein
VISLDDVTINSTVLTEDQVDTLRSAIMAFLQYAAQFAMLTDSGIVHDECYTGLAEVAQLFR